MVASRGGVPERIASWNGAEQLSSRMAAAGFLIPQRYVAWLAAAGGLREEELREECRRYSVDLVQSGGSRPELKAEYSVLFELRKKVGLDNARQDELVALLDEWKRSEARPDAFLQKDWQKGAKHVRSVAQRAARREGFKVTRKGYRLEVTSEFVMEVELDIGSSLSSTIQRISPMAGLIEPRTGWSMGLPWREILLGMQLYNYAEDGGGLVWGIQAYLELAKIFASTLSS